MYPGLPCLARLLYNDYSVIITKYCYYRSRRRTRTRAADKIAIRTYVRALRTRVLTPCTRRRVINIAYIIIYYMIYE